MTSVPSNAQAIRSRSSISSIGVPSYLRVELNDSGRVVKLYLHENIENPHREFESDPERVFHQIAETMTGGAPLPLPKPFTGALDPKRALTGRSRSDGARGDDVAEREQRVLG
jgi:hypothetical protein